MISSEFPQPCPLEFLSLSANNSFKILHKVDDLSYLACYTWAAADHEGYQMISVKDTLNTP